MNSKFLEGYVISTNKDLWCFELDRNRMIYMPHLAVFDENACLPQIGSTVTILNADYEPPPSYFINKEPKQYYLHCGSILKCEKFQENPNKDCLLLKLIKQHNFTIDHLKHLLRIKNEIILVTKDYPEQLALCLFEKLALENNRLDFSSFIFKTILNCQFINAKVSSCDKMPYWSFGCHPSKQNEILLGFFTILKEYGLVLLKDTRYEILCIVKKGNREKLLEFVDKFVFITNFVVFTETVKNYNIGIDYILCDINDIHAINFNYKITHFQTEDNLIIPDERIEKTKILLLKKSMPLLNFQNKPYFWLQIKEVDTVEKEESFFLAIPNLDMYPFLQVGCVYLFSHRKPFAKVMDIELNRLFPNNTFYKLSNDDKPIFELDSSKVIEVDSILSVEEVIDVLKTNKSGLTSFQGIIKEKDFCKPLSSRTQRNVDVRAYGTPGWKTHILYFKTDNCKEETVTLYLNNFETIQTPFGLLPDMRILVRNVLPQSRKYFKSTVLTTFEILNYCPKISFETANLHTDDGCTGNWGNAFNLGSGNLLPSTVLVYTQPQTVTIRSLKIFYACDICPKEVVCCQHDLNLQSKVTMVIADSGGKAMVIFKSFEALRIVFNIIPKEQWLSFCESCKKIKTYEYNKYNKVEEISTFSGALTRLINLTNQVGFTKFEMLCRKLESNIAENNNLPLWFCVSIRSTTHRKFSN